MRTKLMSVGAGLCLTLSFAACGSDDSGDSGSTPAAATGTTATTADTGGVAAIKARVAKDQTPKTTFPGPTEAFDPGKGKMMVIACSFQAPVCASSAKEAAKAVKVMGWSTEGAQDGKFSPQVESGLFDKAIQGKYDGIVMFGVNVNTIKGAVDRVLAANIPIGCINCASGPLKGKDGKIIDAAPDWNAEGEQMSRFLTASSEGKGKIVAFQDKAFPQTTLRTAGLAKVIKTDCPGCEFQIVEQSAGETAEPGPPTFTATLTKNPRGTLTDAIALYDGIGLPMAKTLKSQGRTDLRVHGYDADPPVVQAIADGSLPYGSTIGSPITYGSWAAVDQVARVVAGKTPWKSDALPILTVSKENAAAYAKAGDYEPQGDWKTDVFMKSWGKG